MRALFPTLLLAGVLLSAEPLQAQLRPRPLPRRPPPARIDPYHRIEMMRDRIRQQEREYERQRYGAFRRSGERKPEPDDGALGDALEFLLDRDSTRARTLRTDRAIFGDPARLRDVPVHRYVTGDLNLRTGPGRLNEVVRVLRRGDAVLVGRSDASGWAAVYDGDGFVVGYVYRAGGRLQRQAPPVRGCDSHTRYDSSLQRSRYAVQIVVAEELERQRACEARRRGR